MDLDFDTYFHTGDNWGTYTQLLQKVQTFNDSQKGNMMNFVVSEFDPTTCVCVCVYSNCQKFGNIEIF